MKKNRITKTKLREYGLTPSTVAKFAKGEYVSMKTIVTLCEILKCQPGDIIEVVE